MYNMFHIVVMLVGTMILSLILTPLVRKLAFKIGATDKPDARRVNKKEMPTIGGLAVYLAFFIKFDQLKECLSLLHKVS